MKMHKQLANITMVCILVISMTGAFVAPVSANDPQGFVGVNSENINDNIPAHAEGDVPTASELHGSIQTNHGADTLNVEVTTKAKALGKDVSCIGTNNPPHCDDPEIALKLTDDIEHDGREVTVDKQSVVDNLGHTPEFVTIRHESGDKYTVPVEQHNDKLVFFVEEFSTNTVTFSGEVTVTGNPSVDGSAYSYDINDLDSVSNFTIDVTGSTSSEIDTETANGLNPGDSGSVSVAGSKEPTGASTTDPQMTVTAKRSNYSAYTGSASSSVLTGWDYSNGNWHEGSEVQFDTSKDNIDGVYLYVETAGINTADIHVAKESNDGTLGDGTAVGSHTFNTNTDPHWEYVDFNTSIDMSGSTLSVSIKPDTDSGADDETRLYHDGSGDDRYYREAAGQGIPSAKLASAPVNLGISASNGQSFDYSALGPGQSQTDAIDLPTGSTTLDVTGETGTLEYSVEYEEHQETIDPTITVNGNSTSYTGTLSDGSSASLSTDTTWIKEGTNNVDVAVSTGASADAPTPEVGLDYSHDASDKQSVSYDAEKWSESYNVSKTYASDRNSASLSIPFDGHVVSVRNVEKSVNGGDWQDVSDSSYSFNNTELTVELGSVQKNDKVEVRTTGSKVVVANGDITVLEPTSTDQPLDSKIQLDTWSSDSHIEADEQISGMTVHETYNESWTEASPYSVHEHSTRFIYLPNAGSGDTTQITATDLSARPEVGGDVQITVTDSSTPFKFETEPGLSFGDDVTYRYSNTVSGEEYLLYSETNEVVIDSDVAESPVTLYGTDDSQLLSIFMDDDGSSSSGGDSTGDAIMGPIGQNNGDGLANSTPVIMLVSSGILVGLGLVSRRIFGEGNMIAGIVPKNPVILAASGLVVITTLEHLSGGALTRAVANGLNTVLVEIGPLIGLGAGALVLYYLYKRFVKGQDQTIVVEGETK